MRWGLIPYNTKDWEAVQQKDKSGWYKNAKAEKVFDTWPYKLSIRCKRCIIPSTGYFEPHYNPDGSKCLIMLIFPVQNYFPSADYGAIGQTRKRVKTLTPIP